MSDFSPMPTQWEYYAQQQRDANQQAASNASMYNSWAQAARDDAAYRDQAINYWRQRQKQDESDPSIQWNPNKLADQQKQNLQNEIAYRQGGTLRSPSGQPGMYLPNAWASGNAQYGASPATDMLYGQQAINPAFQKWWLAQQQTQGQTPPWQTPVNSPGPIDVSQALQPFTPQQQPQVIDVRTIPTLADIMARLRQTQNKAADARDRWPENIWQQGI